MLKFFKTKALLLSFLFANIAHAAGFLGVQLEPKEGKASIQQVVKDSPAAQAGLMPGDIVTHLGDRKIKSLESLLAELKKANAGDKVSLSILRKEEAQKITVTLAEKPKAPKRGNKREGLMNAPAPAIDHITEWTNLPKGKKTINLADYKGKTVYLYCFQSWCPGCHSQGFPTMKKLIDHYKEDDSVAFLTVQTVFEGYHANTLEKGKQVLKKFNLTIPMGQDGVTGTRSKLMGDYRTGGTPWTIIIDPDGSIRYSTFHIQSKDAITLIDGFKKVTR